MNALDQRLRDLVRHQRAELHAAGLISDEEYAELLSDHGSVDRLHSYDALRERLRVAEALLWKSRTAIQRLAKPDPQGRVTVEDAILRRIDALNLEPQ